VDDDPASLDVHEKVSFQDVFALLVLLCRIVGLVIFPPEGYSALDTIYIPHGMVASRHLAITRLPFDDVYPTSAYRVSSIPTLKDRPGEISHSLKEIRPAVLPVERPRKHRMYGRQVCLAG